MGEDRTIAAEYEPMAEEIRRYDKRRKKFGNDEGDAPNDHDSCITKLKDGARP